MIMANTYEYMHAGKSLVFGEGRRWMPLEWQRNLARMGRDKKLEDVVWKCVDVVDDYIIREKYGDDLYD